MLPLVEALALLVTLVLATAVDAAIVISVAVVTFVVSDGNVRKFPYMHCLSGCGNRP